MASVLNPLLSSLGLTAPNPAEYSDASTVANQKMKAVTTLQSNISTMNTSLVAATTLGVPSEYVNELKKKVADGETLLTKASNMDPANLQNEVSRLQSEFTASQFKMTQNDYNTQVSELTLILRTVDTRNKEIHEDTTTSKTLVAQYDKLLNDTNEALTTLLNSPPVYKTIDELSGSSGSGISSLI